MDQLLESKLYDILLGKLLIATHSSMWQIFLEAWVPKSKVDHIKEYFLKPLLKMFMISTTDTQMTVLDILLRMIKIKRFDDDADAYYDVLMGNLLLLSYFNVEKAFPSDYCLVHCRLFHFLTF